MLYVELTSDYDYKVKIKFPVQNLNQFKACLETVI